MKKICLLFALWMVLPVLTTRGDDWPQWLGPKRDGVWREAGIADSFAKEGPPIVWRAAIGAGYGGPAVAEGRVYVMDRVLKPGVVKPKDPFAQVTVAGSERIVCLRQSDGKNLWTYEYDCPYTLSYGAGPRSTPAISDGHVYTIGAEGDLVCLDANEGKLIWKQKLSGDKKPTPTWGFAGSPLVDGDAVYCTTADPHGFVAAFDKKSGKQLWSALPGKEPGYNAPIIFDVAGTRQLIFWEPTAIHSLDPQTGKVYWTVQHGPLRYGMGIVTPRLYHDAKLGDLLLVASQYEGSLMLKLGKDEQGKPNATVLWRRAGKSEKKTEALHIVFATPFLRDGYIYGCDVLGQVRCLDIATGDRLWESTEATTYDAGPRKWASAFIIPIGDAGSRCLLANEHGDLLLADLTPKELHIISKAHVLDPTNMDAGRPVLWSMPALAGRCLYWRNDKEMICVSLGKESTK